MAVTDDMGARLTAVEQACGESLVLLVACQAKLRKMLELEADYDEPAVRHLIWLTRDTMKLTSELSQFASNLAYLRRGTGA